MGKRADKPKETKISQQQKLFNSLINRCKSKEDEYLLRFYIEYFMISYKYISPMPRADTPWKQNFGGNMYTFYID